MKKTMFFLKGLALTLAVFGVLAGCGNGSTGDGLPPAGDGSYGTTVTLPGGIKAQDGGADYSGTALTFTHFEDINDTAVSLSSAGLSNPATDIQVGVDGALTFKLGTPSGYTSATGVFSGMGFTVTNSSAKILWLTGFRTASSGGKRLKHVNGSMTVQYVYTDKDVTIKGNAEGVAVNVVLKTGWNTVLGSDDSAVSGKPDGSYSWNIEN